MTRLEIINLQQKLYWHLVPKLRNNGTPIVDFFFICNIISNIRTFHSQIGKFIPIFISTKEMNSMDKMDRQILRLLQVDSSLSVSEVARKVGLSASPCWKRINRLQSDGIIKRKIAVLDADILGFGLTAYVSIKTGEHSSEWLEEFSKTVTKMPEVMEFHRMAGDVDYMLKVIVPDIQAFDDFYKRLIGTSSINEVTSRFSMETIKQTTALPI